MKKTLLLTFALIGITVLALGLTGTAYAHGSNPGTPAPGSPGTGTPGMGGDTSGYGMMGGTGNAMPGYGNDDMMGESNYGYGMMDGSTYGYGMMGTPGYGYGYNMMGNSLNGYGMMGLAGGYGYGMMMSSGYGYGSMMADYGIEAPMHDAMVDALAEALNISPDELEARHDAGETLWDIALGAGLSVDEIQSLMISAHESAIGSTPCTSGGADW